MTRKRAGSKQKSTAGRKPRAGVGRSTIKRKSATRPVARKAAILKKRRRKAATRKRSAKTSWQWPGWSRVMFRFTYKVAFFCYLLVMAVALFVYMYSRDLPIPNMIAGRDHPPRVTVLDRNDNFITTYGQYYGEPVVLARLPVHVTGAFIATEDRNFYHHMGVNPISIGRALLINVSAGNVRQGGSTITQQLAKNLFLSPDRTMKRKAQEVLLSVWLEMQYSKQEILSLYLNNVYFGAGAYGLHAAADRYFDKAPENLSIGEAAMLAGLLKAPSKYAPTSNITAARKRASIVLNAMVDAGIIDKSTADQQRAMNIATTVEREIIAPYAVDHAIFKMQSLIGAAPENIIIHTTIDLEAQKATEKIIANAAELDRLITDDTQIAAVAMEKEGAIRILVGGRDYAASEYNRATQAKRQPGSSFKSWVYLTALENGFKPEDIIEDTPIEIGDWAPKNYKNKYYDAVPMTEAFSRSLNAAAIRLQEIVGRDKVAMMARRSGFTDLEDPGPALALGVMEVTPLELAGAYATFANDAVPAQPYIIRSVTTEDGRSLYEHQYTLGQPVTDEKTLVAMNHMLRSVVAKGSGVHARLPGYRAAGKTGTTQNSRDAWFAGHVSGMVGVVWLGKDDNSPMTVGKNYISGSGAPARIWKQTMLAGLNGRPAEQVVEYIPTRRIIDLLDEVGGFISLVSHEQQSMVDQAEHVVERPSTMEDLLQDVLTETPSPESARNSNGWVTGSEAGAEG
ncbi:MAG: PBP1A family penicillin-binding protein [Parvularculaceae bacterium]